MQHSRSNEFPKVLSWHLCLTIELLGLRPSFFLTYRSARRLGNWNRSGVHTSGNWQRARLQEGLGIPRRMTIPRDWTVLLFFAFLRPERASSCSMYSSAVFSIAWYWVYGIPDGMTASSARLFECECECECVPRRVILGSVKFTVYTTRHESHISRIRALLTLYSRRFYLCFSIIMKNRCIWICRMMREIDEREEESINCLHSCNSLRISKYACL